MAASVQRIPVSGLHKHIAVRMVEKAYKDRKEIRGEKDDLEETVYKLFHQQRAEVAKARAAGSNTAEFKSSCKVIDGDATATLTLKTKPVKLETGLPAEAVQLLEDAGIVLVTRLGGNGMNPKYSTDFPLQKLLADVLAGKRQVTPGEKIVLPGDFWLSYPTAKFPPENLIEAVLGLDYRQAKMILPLISQIELKDVQMLPKSRSHKLIEKLHAVFEQAVKLVDETPAAAPAAATPAVSLAAAA